MYMFIAILFMFMYTVIYNNLVANMRNIHDGMRVVYIYIYIYKKREIPKSKTIQSLLII